MLLRLKLFQRIYLFPAYNLPKITQNNAYRNLLFHILLLIWIIRINQDMDGQLFEKQFRNNPVQSVAFVLLN